MTGKKEGKFKSMCPSCRSENKIVTHCSICGCKVCIICSAKSMCKDCFIDYHSVDELYLYFEAKKEYCANLKSNSL